MFQILINISLLINLVNWTGSAVKQYSAVHACRTCLFSPLFPPKPHPTPSSWLWFSVPSRLSSSSCSLSQESDRYPGLRLPPRTPALSVTSQSKNPSIPLPSAWPGSPEEILSVIQWGKSTLSCWSHQSHLEPTVWCSTLHNRHHNISTSISIESGGEGILSVS